MGRGYIGFSMSVRASEAFRKGLVTKSMITNKLLRERGIFLLNAKMVKSLIDARVFRPAEWHHMGKYYNEVDFYDLDELKNDEEYYLERYNRYLEEELIEEKTPHEARYRGVLVYFDYEPIKGMRGKFKRLRRELSGEFIINFSKVMLRINHLDSGMTIRKKIDNVDLSGLKKLK